MITKVTRVADLPVGRPYTPPVVWEKREEAAQRVFDNYVTTMLTKASKEVFNELVNYEVADGHDEAQCVLAFVVLKVPAEGEA